MVFFWQGDECSINAKGAVAAISLEIDQEGNLHKVCFLNLTSILRVAVGMRFLIHSRVG